MKEVAQEFCYDYNVLKSYCDNYKPVEELEWVSNCPDRRYIIELSEENKKTFDLGWKKLMSEVPDLNITYDNFANNIIIINGQKRKLFKYLNNQKLSEEVGKYKLPNKKLYLVISTNFQDFIMATTGNSWTACTDLKGGDYKFSVIGNIFNRGRFIIYITDMKPTVYKDVKSFNKIYRAFGFINQDGKMVSNIFYPIKEYLPISLPTGNIIPVTENQTHKYSFDKVYNELGYFFYPYLDYTTLDENDVATTKPEYFRFKPLVSVDGKNNYYADLLDLNSCDLGKDLQKCIWKKCDVCGSLKGEIQTFGNRNYCPDCIGEISETCSVCGKNTATLITEDNNFICSDCAAGSKICSCGTTIKKKNETSCKWCRSIKEDTFKNIKFEYLDNGNKYSYFKHKQIKTIPADLKYQENVFEVSELYIKRHPAEKVDQVFVDNEFYLKEIGWKINREGVLERLS